MRRLSDVHLTITRSLTLPSTFMGVGKVNCALRIHFVFLSSRLCSSLRDGWPLFERDVTEVTFYVSFTQHQVALLKKA